MPLAEQASKLIRSGSKLSVSCPSGYCDYCTGATGNRDMSVVIPTHTDFLCTDCDQIAGTYTLSSLSSLSCTWEHRTSSTLCGQVVIRFKISTYSTDNFLRFEVTSQPLGSGGSFARWQDDTTETGYDCSSFSSYSLAFNNKTDGACIVSTSSSASVTSL